MDVDNSCYGWVTHMKNPCELSIASQLDEYTLAEGEPDEIEGLLNTRGGQVH